VSPAPIEDRRLTGIALIILACLFFTGIDSCAKWLVLSGLPPMWVVFVRYSVHMLVIAVLFLPSQRLTLFATDRPWLEAARGTVLLASSMFNFTAVQYLPLTLTGAIFFTIPLWTCALSIPLLGEKVGIRRWAAIAVGFSGVIIATRPWSADAHWAVLLSMSAAVCAALYAIFTRMLAGVDSTATQQFYSATLSSVGIAPVALTEWHWPAAHVDWLAFALIGLLGAFGHQLLTVAHRFAPATTLAPFMYVQIVFMTTSSWLIFNTPPHPLVLVGGSVVLASGLYIWMRERDLVRAGRLSPRDVEELQS
jgi:drug/metabolite transporter (DMT)-like permease